MGRCHHHELRKGRRDFSKTNADNAGFAGIDMPNVPWFKQTIKKSDKTAAVTEGSTRARQATMKNLANAEVSGSSMVSEHVHYDDDHL